MKRCIVECVVPCPAAGGVHYLDVWIEGGGAYWGVALEWGKCACDPSALCHYRPMGSVIITFYAFIYSYPKRFSLS